jgi:molybdate transport system regulatory protein
MDMKTKLYLVNAEGEKFMGIGVLWLLRQVERTGSLRSAAALLGISYSKAYGMIRTLEQQVGVPVMDRRKGGASHEGSSITEFGKLFMDLYDTFQSEAKQMLVEPFENFSQEFDALVARYADHHMKE